LFDCACGRPLGPRLDEACRAYLETKERYAEGAASLTELHAAEKEAYRSFPVLHRPGPLTRMEATYAWIVPFADFRLRDPEREPGEAQSQAALLREVFGYPFRSAPILDSQRLSWTGGPVSSLAEAIYQERAFDRLPELADVLQSAGIDDADILGHFREPGPHVRGCWALDLILAKE